MGRMPSFKTVQRSMRLKLCLYMAALAALLIAAVCIGLFSFGRLNSPRKEMTRTLHTQMDFFRDDMRSLWQDVSTSGVHLSEDMTDLLEGCLAGRGVSFDRLTGDLETLTAIEETMLEPLCQYIRQTRCSGAFVILDAAMRTDSEADVRSGLYVQRNNAERSGNELLLFRGMSAVGKAHGVMPHRKWQQEFHTDRFPDYDGCAAAASGVSLWDACRITALTTLPGTSETAMFLTVPLVGGGGTVYGICGFSVNQTFFGSRYEQPSDLDRLACVLTRDGGDTLEVGAGLITYTENGSCILPEETLTVRPEGDELLRFSGGGYDFVGKLTQLSFTGSDSSALAVLIPGEDYDSAVFGGIAQTAIFAFLLVFFAVVCCVVFARRYLKPVYGDLKRLQAKTPDKAQLSFSDFEPLTTAITTLEGERESLQSQYAETQSQLEVIQADAKQLAAQCRSELDPAVYELFLREYRKLTDRQRQIIDDMVDGLSPQESAEHLNYQKSTVYSYRRDIYEKLNISGKDKLQQLRLRVALLRQQAEQEPEEPPEQP